MNILVPEEKKFAKSLAKEEPHFEEGVLLQDEIIIEELMIDGICGVY
jgi:mycofactocin precursor